MQQRLEERVKTARGSVHGHRAESGQLLGA